MNLKIRYFFTHVLIIRQASKTIVKSAANVVWIVSSENKQILNVKVDIYIVVKCRVKVFHRPHADINLLSFYVVHQMG